MKAQSVAGEATRARLMRAAERLIGRRGYDSVSIRDLTSAADVDVSAIHYHFGSKQALSAAILERRLDQLAEQRRPLLDALAATDPITALDVARCLVEPILKRAGDRTRPARQREAFLFAVSEHSEFATLLMRAMETDIERYMVALRRALPDVPSAVLIRRLLFAISVAQRVILRPFPREDLWLRRYGAQHDTPEHGEGITLIATILQGPTALVR